MLEYEKQIFLDILQEDGLVVAAKGLGLEMVVVNLLKAHCDSGNLVFVLGTEGKHQDWLVSTLKASGASPAPRVISSEVGVNERETSYLEGGVWFVPTRILVVDLLKKRIPIELITGFVVWKAHNILKNHQDSFILRLFRQGNTSGFIKAFSNHAPGFTGGLSKVEQILKALFVRKLFLWPRYHAGIKSCLSEGVCKPNVVELHLEMSNSMLQLQNTLLDLIKTTIQEMKRLNPMLDAEEVTVENAICDAFHKLLHSQLDPVWHALSERTKLLLTDLKLFHYMVRTLLTHDSVSFYALVKAQRGGERVRAGSGWQLLPSAEVLFTTAARRVFPDANTEQPDPEPSPKWLALAEIMAEIHRGIKNKDFVADTVERKMEDLFDANATEEKEEATCDNGTILVLTRDERTCLQLQLFLRFGSSELLNIQLKKLFPKNKNIPHSSEETVDEEKDKIEVQEAEEENIGGVCVLALSQTIYSQLEADKKTSLAGCFEESFLLTQTIEKPPPEDMTQDPETSKATPTIVIKPWTKDLMSLPQYLADLMPRWVVMYDVDITVVRQLEVFQRRHQDLPITVYFLIYGGTIEEQAYLTSLRKEKEAFNFLIEEKSRLVIPEDRSDCPEITREIGKASDIIIASRKGGTTSPKKKQSRVIVDMREFRSELPALIHARGIEIEPLTITVGDYILTPDICVERKSISDLIQSLNSGRLYNQAQAMTRHYSRPMLLIEFDKDKPFDLQDRYYLSTDSSSEQLVTKLQLLTLHFPQLRLVWSPSPHATASLFQELKENREEPDPASAVGIGIEETPSDLLFNPAPQSFLQHLPGVTTKNLPVLLRKGASMDTLRRMSVEELTSLLENSGQAETLYDVFHKKFLPADPGSTGKSARPTAARGRKRRRFH